MKGETHGARYTQDIHHPVVLRETVEITVKKLRAVRARLPFNSIAVRGQSGIIVGSPVSIRLGLPLLTVRKPRSLDGDSHDSSIYKVSGFLPESEAWRYVFIDDFITTGETVKATIHTLKKFCQYEAMPEPTCVGIFLYDNFQARITKWTMGSKTFPVWLRRKRR